jgi:DNA-binding NtrC family response regulator
MNLPTVLLVDDEARLRDVLLRSIRSLGHEAIGAGSAEEALRLIAEQPRDVAIVDLNLPGMSGMDLFAELRRRHPATQVIVLTGFGDLDTAQQAIRLDVVDFLTKPCHLGDLDRALDRAARRLFDPDTKPDPRLDEPELIDTRANEDTGEADPAPAAVPAPEPQPGQTLEELERDAIYAALQRHDGHRRRAADELGISLRKLYYCLSRYEK